MVKIDQDSIDELTSYSQNSEIDYKRAIDTCQKIVDRIQGKDKIGCIASTIEGKLEECSFKNSAITNGLWLREARRLHKNYMASYGLRNGYVKSIFSEATFKQLAEELDDIYEDAIKYILNQNL
jgi:hypothetical protein